MILKGGSMVSNLLVKNFTDLLLSKNSIRKNTEKIILRKLKNDFLVKNKRNRNLKEAEYRYAFYEAVLTQFEKNFNRNYLSKDFMKRLLNNVFLQDKLLENHEIKEDFYKQYGIYPPGFLTLSPTKKCNLNCTGCYANSSGINSETLEYKYVEAILRENYEKWGNKGVVVSGGEPFLYKSEGKNLLDIAENFNNMFFMVYTNGTLIDNDIAHKIYELGNLIPAISVEGYEQQTDERRGKGVYRKIIDATTILKNYGIPFGISVTVTKKNFDIINKEEFYDYYFEKIGASFMWVFQFMPIGRGTTIDLMLSAEQRRILWETWSKILFEKKYPVADFWNSGMISYGCIAYGRAGGYLYIDWNGNIMPCVFVPYYEDNIKQLYLNGKTLTDALFSKFFENGRKWQYSYGYNHPVLNNVGSEKIQNLLLPCSIRDHYRNFRENILTVSSKPEDEYAEIALKDKDYYEKLANYESDLKKEFDPIWENQFKNINKNNINNNTIDKNR